MGCKECGKPKCNGECGCKSPKVLQINNPAEYITFHKVSIPAAMGDSTTNPPKIGAYRNALVYYEADHTSWMYSTDGIPTLVTGEKGETGPQGPAGTITVGTTTTGEPGADAEVENVGTPENAILNFTIPRGPRVPEEEVQEEIDNKLDEMAEDGTLEEIITAYLQSNVTWTFDNVEEMQSATNLIAGSFAKTQGYYTVGDGGGAEYIIVDEAPSDSIYETLNSGLYAKMIINNRTIYTKQTGAKGDGTTDDTTKIQAILNLVKNVYPDKFTIIVNGLHFVQTGLTLNGASGDFLKNIVIRGSEAMRDYNNMDNIKDGFIFDTTGHFDFSDFNQTYGIKFEYTRGLVVENLRFTTNESVTNGLIPKNNIEGIRIRNSSSNELRNCNITCFYIGYYCYGSGLSYIKNNNFALCNVGIRSAQTGDSTIEDNYFNTMGWDLYDSTGTINSDYTSMKTAGHVYGYGIWFGDGGNITVRGGKIEWVAVGIWQDYTTNMIYDTIHFDRCSVCGFAYTGHNRPNARASILNCNFTGCGGILPDPTENHIGGIGRSSIGALNAFGLQISNCRITADNGRLQGAFKTSSYYYAPVYALYFDNVYESSFINNRVWVDRQYAYSLVNTELLYDNNICNKPWSMASNCIVYRQDGIKREIYHATPNDITNGNFDYNDVIYDQNKTFDRSSTYRVTTAGSKQTINQSVSVVTVGTDFYPGDGTVIDLGTNYSNAVRTGSYVNIAGVTGTKKIIGVIFRSSDGHWYAKLDSACDVAVLNATMTNQAPAFTSLS